MVKGQTNSTVVVVMHREKGKNDKERDEHRMTNAIGKADGCRSRV